jgi:2-octaprenyl-6-methoxyphenol hydroxylase
LGRPGAILESDVYHVAVIGAALVGAATALALDRLGLRVVLIDACAAMPAPGEDWDTRIYAISPGNADWLRSLGAWPSERVQPVQRMLISGDGGGGGDSNGGGRLALSAYEAGEPELAHILESSRLQAALDAALAGSGVRVLRPARLAALALEERAVLTLDDGSCIDAELAVAADGAQSPTRVLAGMTVEERDMGVGVVANFACERAHGGTAFQWFRDGDILAWLPLPGNRMSMVWSTNGARAAELVALDAAALASRVAEAGAHTLGELQVLTPAAAFPMLRRKLAQPWKPGLVLVGDAAHVVHPLAGQGVNLGFRDVRGLAEALVARGPAGCGEAALLARHARHRAEDVLRIGALTDGLRALFGTNLPGVRGLRNAGMNWIGGLDIGRAQLARAALA